jgi:Ca2+-binding RTX toxin-like protein
MLIGGPGVDVVQGNGPSNPVGCFQNDILGQYEALTGGDFGDVVDLSDEAGPLTIVFNADGSISITPSPADFVSGVEGVIGSAGNDTITGNANDNFLGGGGGDDTLAGGLGDDCVVGGAGNDILDENAPLKADGTPDYGPTGNGADALDGGPGADDTVTYSARTNRTLVHLGVISWFNDGADPNANAITDECDDVFFTTENAITGSGNDILSADYLNNQSDNEFTGGAGNDQMEGGAGNDTFHEGSAANGADAMEGDAGADVADYSQRTNPVLVSLDGNSNDGEAGEGDNVGAGLFSIGLTGACALGFCDEDIIEDRAPQGNGNVIDLCGFPGQSEPFAEDEAVDLVDAAVENVMGGSGNDTLVGDNASNVLTGNAGNDTLTGEGGSDRLVGGDGDDTLAGGAGNDELDGGAGTNWADFSSSASAVNVNLGSNTSNGEGNDTLAGIVNVNGSSHNDSINGDASANVLNGRGGNDTINGRGGDDNVNGGSGVDELNGNGGNDRASGGSGNDAVRGQAGADRLQGGPGADFVGGGGGNDRLSGNAGNDFLNGGAGTDTCNVGAPGLGNGDQRINCP